MASIEDLRLQYFEDCKEIIASLSSIENESELIEVKADLDTLVEKTAFLKHMVQNAPSFDAFAPVPPKDIEPEEEPVIQTEELAVNFESPESSQFQFEIAGPALDEVQDSIQAPSNLEQSEPDEVPQQAVTFEDEVKLSHHLDSETHHDPAPSDLTMDSDAPEVVAMDSVPSEDKAAVPESKKPAYHEEEQERSPVEKKIKLAHIKGLTATVSSLFDDPLFEQPPVQDQTEKTQESVEAPSQEFTKPRSHFKLDLNDRIAFSKILFDGSQSELNHTVNELNEFQDLETAKEYLSQVYHQRDWKKVDEYAQRLWTLVENKFH